MCYSLCMYFAGQNMHITFNKAGLCYCFDVIYSCIYVCYE